MGANICRCFELAEMRSWLTFAYSHTRADLERLHGEGRRQGNEEEEDCAETYRSVVRELNSLAAP